MNNWNKFQNFENDLTKLTQIIDDLVEYTTAIDSDDVYLETIISYYNRKFDLILDRFEDLFKSTSFSNEVSFEESRLPITREQTIVYAIINKDNEYFVNTGLFTSHVYEARLFGKLEDAELYIRQRPILVKDHKLGVKKLVISSN